MTAYDTNLPTTTAARFGATATGAVTPVTPAKRDIAPVIIWRTATEESDAAPDADISDSPLTPRLAHHLVVYSDVHTTVIDLGADDHLRHAAEMTGRHYLAVTNPAELATLTEQPQPAALIVLRWPRSATSTPEQEPNSLLTACHRHLAHDGCTIVARHRGRPGSGWPHLH